MCSVRRTGASPALTVGDYWVYRDGGDFFLFDAGPVGPDHLPAHAHADLLGFEASLSGRRLFVDSGVFNYQDDSTRRWCRSSAAHNVLVVDGEDQCDAWSRFRMGRRGWPRGFESGRTEDFHWARAEHNAYRHLGVPCVGRWVGCRGSGPWFCVDWARGTGQHEISSRLHIHPQFQVEQAGQDEIRLTAAEITASLHFLTPGRLAVNTGWYCSRFGHRQENPVLEWTSTGNLPAVCAWSLVRGDSRPTAELTWSPNEELLLQWSKDDRTIVLQPTGRTPPG